MTSTLIPAASLARVLRNLATWGTYASGGGELSLLSYDCFVWKLDHDELQAPYERFNTARLGVRYDENEAKRRELRASAIALAEAFERLAEN